MATYLTLVNDVLARLREDAVATIASDTYATLIGKFINDAKRQVEDSWNWDALRTTITVNTVAGTSNYTVTGSGLRHKNVTVNNYTSKYSLINVPIQYILDQADLASTTNAQPSYYAWNGNDGTDSKVELYPTPSGVYALKFNMYAAQADLYADADILLMPKEPVIMGAYARALVERGEDGGLSSSEAYGLYKGILADQIAIEASRFVENDSWSAC